jgi:hypothetical protein|tara:strand:- start:1013 stop:1414 length:402 start_codon:yes stop_codon:yes gene_type:complete
MKVKVRQRALRAGYRSGLEQDTAKFLKKRGIGFTYEEMKIKWVDPKTKTYTPDFVLDNGIIIETKGRFISPDRAKHLAVRDQYPELDIRFVFTNSKSKLYKGSKTTYGMWCNKYDFKYADRYIPEAWLKEPKR